MSIKLELLSHRYKKNDDIIQFKMHLSEASSDFHIEDLENNIGVTFGYNEIKAVKGGKVQYTYEYDRSIHNSVFNVRESIISYYSLGDIPRGSLVICNDYGLGYVLHVPKTKVDKNRDINYWIKQARVLLVSAFLDDCDCSTTRRIDFCAANEKHFTRMTDRVHAVANQLNHVLYDAPCLQLLGNIWDEHISNTIDPYYLKYFTSDVTQKK